MTKKNPKHKIKNKKPPVLFRKKFATDALKISNINDPTYNIKNLYAEKYSKMVKNSKGSGIDYSIRTKKDGPLPLPKSYGAINLNPYHIQKHLGSIFI
jgi:hypothetical protein